MNHNTGETEAKEKIKRKTNEVKEKKGERNMYRSINAVDGRKADRNTGTTQHTN